MTRSKTPLPVIGWREWVGLPGLGVDMIKAKVDTGARTSSLHAVNLKKFEVDGEQWARFVVYPEQRKTNKKLEVEAKILEFRSVRSSSGVALMRPVIITDVILLGITWQVELTLANRSDMGFRMLLGREALRKRFIVDSGKSYYSVKPKRKKSIKR